MCCGMNSGILSAREVLATEVNSQIPTNDTVRIIHLNVTVTNMFIATSTVFAFP